MARRGLIHAAIVALAAVPLAGLIVAAARDDLGANPVETLSHETGEWALRLLLASLAITPLRIWLGWRQLAPYRRTLGLLCFGYACLHVAIYLLFDLSLAWDALVDDVIERPYITAGATAFLCLLPLAITSTRGWVRRLGRRWRLLHRLVYLAALAAVVHFLWLVKADLREPLIYAGLLALLLAARARPLVRAATSRQENAAAGR